MERIIFRGASASGNTYKFTLEDNPFIVEKGRLALLKCQSSEILDLDTIVRGDSAYSLFEGDVLENPETHERWLVCYQRGFYAINKDRKIVSLDDVVGFPLVDNYFDNGFYDVKMARKKSLSFYVETKRYNTVISLVDIMCYEDTGIRLRTDTSEVIPYEKCHYDLGVKYKSTKCYENALVAEDSSTYKIVLRNGRVVLTHSCSDDYIEVNPLRRQ